MDPQYEIENDGKISEQNELNGLQIIQFEYPSQWIPILASKFSINYLQNIFRLKHHGRGRTRHDGTNGVLRRRSPLAIFERKFFRQMSNLSFVRLG